MKIFTSSNRHLSNSPLIKRHTLKFPLSSFSLLHHRPPRYPHIAPLPSFSVSSFNRHYTFLSTPNCSSRISSLISNSPLPPPNSIPLGFLNSLSSPNASLDSIIASDHFARLFSGSNSNSFEWNFALEGVNDVSTGIVGDKGPLVTVVLLGWLGAKRKHLRRYVELYNSKGINAVTFVASARDVLSFDLGRRLQERISGLARELTSWLSETEKDGRERFLLIHTFSNTGWLAYGAILQRWQDRQDLLKKIKGCVVDSGGDPHLNPKVWAAGFTAAFLKKRSSSAYPSFVTGEGNGLESGVTVSKIQEKLPRLIETFLLVTFEKLFSFLLNLPDVNQRLMKLISILSKNQPPCPQLYLYSTADKVIPYQSVESFIDEQKRMGSQVLSFNFGLSPHVDHFRTFPEIYESQLGNILKECWAMVKQV